MAPTYKKVTPSLPVTSVPAAIQYYTEVLGFKVAGRDRDDHTWLQLTDGEVDKADGPVNIYLRRRTFPDVKDDVQFGKIHITISGAEDELEQLWTDLSKKGAKGIDKVVKMPWGLKHFHVFDDDGNIVQFNQAIAGWTPGTRSDA